MIWNVPARGEDTDTALHQSVDELENAINRHIDTVDVAAEWLPLGHQTVRLRTMTVECERVDEWASEPELLEIGSYWTGSAPKP